MKPDSLPITFFERVWATASRCPDNTIIRDSLGSWTWLDLIWQARAYADAIERECGAGGTRVVPILVDRSGETIAAILGALMSGRAVAPISAQQPANRIKKCIAALEADLLVSLDGDCALDREPIPGFKTIGAPAKRTAKGLPPAPSNPLSDKLLYVLFTSGSTGVPKGVMVDWGNLENTMLWGADMLDWEETDVIGCATNFFFDISMFDVFTALYFDTVISVYSHPGDATSVLEQTGRFGVTSIFSVPAFFSHLLWSGALDDPRLSSLRRIISGGDFFPPSHVLRWLKTLPKVEIYNAWGPTETSIVNTMHRVDSADFPALELGRHVSVGRAHPRMRFCLIDAEGRIIEEPGRHGEICMLGRCVTRGYLGDAETTQRAYVEIAGQPAFRTQDIGVVDTSGNLFVTGRLGAMVKIAGYRVDLGEVESAATMIPEIHLAAAFVYEPDEGIRELWLAVEPANQRAPLDIFSIKGKLRQLLPQYMVPKRICAFERLPRNPNGKIDRKATSQQAIARVACEAS